MSTPSGMAIDPSLLFNQQARAAAVAAAAAAAAAATPGQRQPEASGSMLTTAAVKQEQFDDDENDVNAVGGEADKTAQANGQGHDDAKGDASMEQDAAVDGAPAGHTVNGHLTSSNGMPVAPPSKLEDDEDAPLDLRDDVELAAFLAKLEDYDPLLPDPVTRFYLEKAGFQSSDDRVTRMLGLAAQKFVSDIARDAYAFARTRITTGPGRMPGPSTGVQAANKMRDRTRTVLTIEDLASAMHDYGIDASRAPYYR